jgi:hypothetical protein
MAAWVFWVICNDGAGTDHVVHFCGTDETRRPRHLPDSRGQKQHAESSGLANGWQDCCLGIHLGLF